MVDGLAVTVQMRQAAFAQDERVGLTVTVKNTTEQVARLNATQFLGSTTFGRYQFTLTDAAGAKWGGGAGSAGDSFAGACAVNSGDASA